MGHWEICPQIVGPLQYSLDLKTGIYHWEEIAKIKVGMKAGDQVQDAALRNERVEIRRVLVWEHE